MNTVVPPGRWFRTHQSLTAGLLAVALLSSTFWLVTDSLAAPRGQGSCTVCHRRTTDVTLPCDGLEYQRHIDHGDAIGSCFVTPPINQ